MKVKLIKINGEYLLNPSIVGTKLSLKNCEAIANGYDLDELVDKVITTDFENELYVVKKISKIVAKEVAKTILEILGDKKFSEEDVKKAYMTGWNSCSNFNGYDENQEFIELPDCIQSLQQTEWDVEICTYVDTQGYDIPNADSFSHGNIFTNTGIPKLDADGCLILKRI